MDKLLDEKEAAVLLNISVKTLQARRSKGGGPRFVKLGRSVRYAMSELKAYVSESQRTSTSDSGRSPAYQPSACVTQVTSFKKSWPTLHQAHPWRPLPVPSPLNSLACLHGDYMPPCAAGSARDSSCQINALPSPRRGVAADPPSVVAATQPWTPRTD